MVYKSSQLNAGADAGTVTQINTGTGLTGGPITTTGTISIADNTANSLAGFDNTGEFSGVTVSTGLSLSGGILTATGVDTGITQLTGDVTAGPGSGSQAATLATVNSNVGSFTYASLTVNAKGLITAASSGSAPEVPLTFSTGLTRSVNTITADLSTGISGGQSVIGGTASGNNLTLSSTSNGTKGKILFGTSAYDEVNNRLGIANTSPSFAVDVTGQIRQYVQDVMISDSPTVSGPYTGFSARGTGLEVAGIQFNTNDVKMGAFRNTYPLRILSSNVEAIRIDTSQNVSIGTTSKLGRLGIKATTADGTDYALYAQDSNTGDILTLRNDAKLNLGTGSTIAAQFVINSTNAASGIYSPAYSSGSANIITYKDFNGNSYMTLDMTGGAAAGKLTLTSSSSAAVSVGRQGATNPSFQIDASAATSATGVKITAAAAAGGVTIGAISSGSNEGLNVQSLGTGSLNLTAGGSASSRVNISTSGNTYTNNIHSFACNNNSLVNPRYGYTTSTDTTLTASTEAPGAYYNFSNARGHSTGTLSLQRDFIVQGSPHTFVGSSALTNLATLAVIGSVSGNNSVATNVHGLYIPTWAANSGTGTVANAYGITVVAPTGGSSINAAINATGDILLSGSLGATGTRVTKGWFTDLEITNAPTINGTAATGSGGLARATSPTFVTPILGVATGTSLNLTADTNQIVLDSDGTFTGTINATGMSASRIWTLPNASGTFTIGGNSFTGTGNIVRDNTPTLITPVLGAATGTSLNLSGLTASSAVATDGSKNLVSVTNTGSGNNVLATSPVLVTPALGTPTAGVLTSCTGLPLTTGVTGTLPVANGGTGVTAQPKFYAYRTSTQAIADNTLVVVQLTTELFDTNNNFDTSTYKFTPTVAGYYELNAGVVYAAGVTLTPYVLQFNKNGTPAIYSQRRFSGTGEQGTNVSGILFMNGSTDYIELVTYQNTLSSQNIQGSVGQTFMCGAFLGG